MGKTPRGDGEGRLKLIVHSDQRQRSLGARAAALAWLACAALLLMGTVSSLLGARIAAHSVTVPPLGELPNTQLEPTRAVALPEFRTGEEAEAFVSDPAPTLEEASTVRREPTTEPAREEPREAPRPAVDEAPAVVEQPAAEAAPRPGVYVITRSTVDAVANDPESVGAQSTHIAVERTDDGTPIGLRITGIGRDSALRSAGIRNGDVLIAVNGETVDSPQRGVAMYQRLSTSSGVSVELLRRGERRRIRIEVTDVEPEPLPHEAATSDPPVPSAEGSGG